MATYSVSLALHRAEQIGTVPGVQAVPGVLVAWLLPMVALADSARVYS